MEANEVIELRDSFKSTDWISMLVHSYQAIDWLSKKQLWKIKHTEIVDLYTEESKNTSKVLTRGSILYVINFDEQEKKSVWYDNLGS